MLPSVQCCCLVMTGPLFVQTVCGGVCVYRNCFIAVFAFENENVAATTGAPASSIFHASVRQAISGFLLFMVHLLKLSYKFSTCFGAHYPLSRHC